MMGYGIWPVISVFVLATLAELAMSWSNSRKLWPLIQNAKVPKSELVNIFVFVKV